MKRKSDQLEIRVDPAPSRSTYLFNRFWLRKSFRLSLMLIITTLIASMFLFLLNKNYDLMNCFDLSSQSS